MTSPVPDGAGAARCMENAMRNAGVNPQQVDYINAHGTSTPLNDSTETFAIKRLFGERAYEIPVSSSKSVTGHALGATGAIEAIFSIYALKKGIVPPTWNYETEDPACDLDYVPNASRIENLDFVLSNSFGMGGQNACLVFKQFPNGQDKSSVDEEK